ncbi:MAG: FliA/WhiG family RNA polymerase sigma factor [Planctomycetes bacterium]|nr:FliA/WhiG family RNA polymerase sigma factor [Planctomycetota bacterium]
MATTLRSVKQKKQARGVEAKPAPAAVPLEAPQAESQVPAPAPAAFPAKGTRSERNAIPRDDQSTEELWRAFKASGDVNLRNALIERYLPMVRYISERLLQTLPKSIELDDLCSAGQFGLMDAIDGFDLSRGIKFKTYCTTRIRGSILDELRSQDWVPRLVRLKANRLEKAWQKLESEFGREPTNFELAQQLEIPVEQLDKELAESTPRAIFSLSDKWDEGEDDKSMEKVEILEDKRGADALVDLHGRDLMEVITRVLTKKERLILVMYYREGLTMREIGEILQLTESRVCQIHSNVMARLKPHLEGNESALLA